MHRFSPGHLKVETETRPRPYISKENKNEKHIKKYINNDSPLTRHRWSHPSKLGSLKSLVIFILRGAIEKIFSSSSSSSSSSSLPEAWDLEGSAVSYVFPELLFPRLRCLMFFLGSALATPSVWGVIAPNAPMTTGATDVFTLQAFSSSSLRHWYFSSSSCSFILMLPLLGIATSTTMTVRLFHHVSVWIWKSHSYTNDCTSKDSAVKILKFADDTTVIGLIRDGDESAYQREVERLVVWCSQHNLELNTLKTVEMVVDFRKLPTVLSPLTISNSPVSMVDSFKFLGTIISRDLKWETNINSIVKKAQQRMYFFRQLRKYGLPQELLIIFYTAAVESILCSSITVWFGSATKMDKCRLQRIIKTAGKIIGAKLPSVQELYISRTRKKAVNIVQDATHPASTLFHLLPSGRRYRSLYTKTTRHKNSFFPSAISLLNL
uniref:Alkylated DNA repair protein AlkB homologue 8 N-terminal domain-containing protein n=1 Tax=Nothobranchius furzeri TaxID=105023 RepID=A0A8C6NSQ5_NOTFU